MFLLLLMHFAEKSYQGQLRCPSEVVRLLWGFLLLCVDTCIHHRPIGASFHPGSCRRLFSAEISKPHLVESLEETVHLAAFDLAEHIELLEAR